MAFANQLIRRLPVWAVYLLGALPAPWLFYLGLTGGLGVEPVKALEHKYGELALQLLILTLAISPLRRLLGLNLLKFRRAAGLLCFFYVLCHLLVWLVLDVQIVSQILTDIAKRPYITIGMGAFVLMLPLALTSSNLAVRKLGRAWSRLHRLTYAAAVLGAAHYVMLSKGFQIEPLIYLGLVLFLLALRLAGSRWLRQAAGVGA
ncbi:protein-methionine-sulfoxide reductase heme-binding subunit MsrQ [Leisingera aquaemixtae]|uniref:protein-methionine-sulfoxide reductase heme-binding subunit MsrQ n=1 Tax=Leisingera aquaemixtae TaxID=1396826 RepID=UPI0021A755A4|nr:protein-methionine-sulfoxide reductase heme-binding subunit MsrQ [Leisingera aquaemixtae]UWQ37498.1 protein-methionine-sulfoxide reductase heme-binding subunit MsrQ [Leisingera aquaemixtae]